MDFCSYPRGIFTFGMDAMTRNERIFERFQAGESLQKLGDFFGLSRERVRQLVNREAANQGREKRKRLSPPGGNGAGAPIFHLSEKQKREFLDRTKSASEIAEEVGCSARLVFFRCRGARRNWREKIWEFYSLLYDKFQAGMTIKELAQQFRKTPGVIQQCIIKYRRRHGIPARLPRGMPCPT